MRRVQAVQLVNALINQADIVLKEYPITSIIQKPQASPDAPNADKRYYWSIGPYFWPQLITAQNPRGEPWFRRDGVFNQQVSVAGPGPRMIALLQIVISNSSACSRFAFHAFPMQMRCRMHILCSPSALVDVCCYVQLLRQLAMRRTTKW